MVLFSPYPCVLLLSLYFMSIFPSTKFSKCICVDSFSQCLGILVSSLLSITLWLSFYLSKIQRSLDLRCLRDGTQTGPVTMTTASVSCLTPRLYCGRGGEREKERREKGGCGIRQPHFYPLGLCSLLVFTCRISIKTENVRETERFIKNEIRVRDRHCVLEVCWTRVLMVSSGSKCPFTVWDQDQTHIIFYLPVPNTLTRDAPID